MIDTRQGTIKTITEQVGTSPKGKWKRFIFEFIDGSKLSTFNENIGLKFKPTQYVTMTGEQVGQFWNMSTMALIADKSQTLDVTKPEAVKETNEVVDLLRQILAVLKNGNNSK